MLSKKNQIYWYFIIRDWNIFYGFILLHDTLYNIAAQFAEAGLIRKVSWLQLSKSFGVFKGYESSPVYGTTERNRWLGL